MGFGRLLRRCVLESRCPLCGEGRLFQGVIRMRGQCAVCGLDYDQWVGEWITPTYLASSVGMLVGIAIAGWMLATERGLEGPLPPELWVSAVAGGAALLSLRPSKAFWLACLFGMGGIEVSAETRARLRWSELASDGERLDAADRYARRVRPKPPPTAPRISSLRELLFPRVGRARREPGARHSPPGPPRRERS